MVVVLKGKSWGSYVELLNKSLWFLRIKVFWKLKFFRFIFGDRRE